MSRYEFNNAHEWLYSKRIPSWLVPLLNKIDDDTIQDVYQSDMDADGYFDDLDEQEDDEDNNE